MKDVLDIYVMSFITKINTDELYQIWRETGRELGDFEAYKTQIAELGEAYNKMKGIKNKPDFIEVYDRVNDIVSCFECQREKTISKKEKLRQCVIGKWKGLQNVQENVKQGNGLKNHFNRYKYWN